MLTSWIKPNSTACCVVRFIRPDNHDSFMFFSFNAHFSSPFQVHRRNNRELGQNAAKALRQQRKITSDENIGEFYGNEWNHVTVIQVPAVMGAVYCLCSQSYARLFGCYFVLLFQFEKVLNESLHWFTAASETEANLDRHLDSMCWTLSWPAT